MRFSLSSRLRSRRAQLPSTRGTIITADIDREEALLPRLRQLHGKSRHSIGGALTMSRNGAVPVTVRRFLSCSR
jgi:hypothetical protein